MASEIKLILGDCMEGMREMKDKAFDLAIVDPPYFEAASKRIENHRKQLNLF